MQGEAVPHIEAAFPDTSAGGAVDRAKLAAAALHTPDGFARLEALVHPLVRDAQWQFLQEQMAAGAPLCVLDIPLLFETGGDALVDVVARRQRARGHQMRARARPARHDAGKTRRNPRAANARRRKARPRRLRHRYRTCLWMKRKHRSINSSNHSRLAPEKNSISGGTLHEALAGECLAAGRGERCANS